MIQIALCLVYDHSYKKSLFQTLIDTVREEEARQTKARYTIPRRCGGNQLGHLTEIDSDPAMSSAWMYPYPHSDPLQDQGHVLPGI